MVGRSHECDWPKGAGLDQVPVLTRARTRFESSAQIDAEVRSRLAAGESLYELDADRLAALKPDLIITQDLCEVCSIDLATVRAVVAEMHADGKGRPEVLSLNPATVEGVFDDVLTVGRALGLEREALGLVVELRERMFRAAEFVTPFAQRPIVAFLEWTDPLFIGGHWTPQLIERAGGSHPLNPTVPVAGAGAAAGMAGESMTLAGKSVRVPPEVLVASRPEVVIVCPCGLGLEEALRQTREMVRRAWWSEMMHGACHRLGSALGAESVLPRSNRESRIRPCVMAVAPHAHAPPPGCHGSALQTRGSVRQLIPLTPPNPSPPASPPSPPRTHPSDTAPRTPTRPAPRPAPLPGTRS